MAEEVVVPVEGQTAPVVPAKLEPSDELPGVVADTQTAPVPETPQTEQTTESTEEPFMQFKTQAEYDAWAEAERQKLLPQEENTEDEPLFSGVDEFGNPAPKDWKEVIDVAKRELSKEQETKAKKYSETQSQFDQQYESFARSSGLPSLSTPEGQELNKQITQFGVKYNQTSITAAAELWKVVPKEQGGGLNYTAPKPVSSSNPNRAVSAKIGGGSGSATPNKQGRSYAELHNKDIDTLIQEELGEL